MSLYGGIQMVAVPLTTSESGDKRMIGGEMATAVEAVLVDDTEDERVIRWRLEQLAKAGYTWACAMVIAANHDIDLHRAVSLLRQGCPDETAVRILL
jgi:tRNA uridine 5-carbamoylmethylation protein Kti12